MPRKNALAFDGDEAEATRLSAQLSGVIGYVMEKEGYTQASFARAIGLSRTTLNSIMNSTERKNRWRLPSLCAAARVLHVTVPDIFLATEPGTSETDDRLEALAMKASLGATDLGSPERLERLFVRALHLFSDEADKLALSKKNLAAFCGCRRLEVERGAPKFYAAYTSGRLTDEEAISAILRGLAYVRQNGGLGEVPLWVGLQKTFAK